ncbi:MAG TPA: DUF4126 family protein [Baekduia sp.]|nr:DUF4126 family protein [Baekduia sp.]
MDLLLDILQGLGLAVACGLSPVLPALVAGAMGAADAGIDFGGTAFEFLEEPWFLLVLAVLLVATSLARLRYADRLDVGPTGIAFGALLFAGSLDDRHDTWWYGLVLGGLVAAGTFVVVRTLVGRVRDRFARQGDARAAAALPVYTDGAGGTGAALSVALPPLGALLTAFVAVLGVRQRRQGERKYAGLRILR